MFKLFKENLEYFKEVFRIAMPAIGGFLGLVLFDFVDIFWIEKMGAQAVAAVASAGFIVGSIYSITQIPSTGCTALVAQFYGAGMRKRCWQVIIQATWLAMVMALVIAALCLPFVDIPFKLMSLDEASTEVAVGYFRIMLLGLPFIFLDMLFGSIFNAYGDNKISNVIMLICLVINGILDPLFMFGWFGFPQWGVEGAAVATIIGHFISFAMKYYVLLKRHYVPTIKYFFSTEYHYLKEIFKIGFPNAASSWVWTMVYPVLMRQITPFGTLQVSALGVAQRLESFPYFVAQGLAIALTSLTGFYLGKHETKKIDKVLNCSLLLAITIIGPFILLFMFVPHNFVNLIASDWLIVDAGANYLFIISFFELFMCFETMFVGLFTGLGKTLPTTLITMPMTIGRIPLAWFLATFLGWGIDGVWWAISITCFTKAIGLAILYKYYKFYTRDFQRFSI